MKLELKHLSIYLPYRVHLMNKYGSWHNTTLNKSLGIYEMLDMKLILRPLSDLNKIIKHNGIEINLFDKIEIYKGSGVDYLIEQIKLGLVEVIIFNLLLEYHFDLFGLIEKGLAIDKNTLKNN